MRPILPPLWQLASNSWPDEKEPRLLQMQGADLQGILHLTGQRVQHLKQTRTPFRGEVSSSKTLAELLLGFMELYAGRWSTRIVIQGGILNSALFCFGQSHSLQQCRGLTVDVATQVMWQFLAECMARMLYGGQTDI